MPNVFRLNARYYFLTYPQCTTPRATLWDLLHRLGARWSIICTEQHADGNAHLHAVVDWGRKKDTRNSRAFDIDAFHPNVQAVKNLNASIAYCKKEGEWEEFGITDQEEEENFITIAQTVEEGEYYHYCLKKKVPYQYAAKFHELARKDRGNTIVDDSLVQGRMRQDLQFLALPEVPQSSVLVGPSGCGKTTWALKKTPKPALLVSHMDDLRHFDPNYHKSLVFDDMKFIHMPLQAQIHIVDQDWPRSIHCRYRTAPIPAHTHKIFTCNEQPFADHPAIERRITRILNE